MVNAVNKRLIDVINFLKGNGKIYNEVDFAKKTNINKSFLSDMKAGRKEVSEKTIKIITNSFPEISYKWLLTGEGEMVEDGLCYFTGMQPVNSCTNNLGKMEGSASIINQSNTNGDNINNNSGDMTKIAYGAILRLLKEYTNKLQDENNSLKEIISILERIIK
jgi:hypothetical protein